MAYSEYKDLTPIDSIENGDEYIEALNWAFQNKKVKNIALTGPYGAGKSSIIDTFLRQNDEDKSAINKIRASALKISMATFLKGNVAADDSDAKIKVDADEVEKGIEPVTHFVDIYQRKEETLSPNSIQNRFSCTSFDIIGHFPSLRGVCLSDSDWLSRLSILLRQTSFPSIKVCKGVRPQHIFPWWVRSLL